MNKEKYPILSRINCPSDLKKLSSKETDALADEIRHFLVESVSVTGGHLASNLGVVELTLALHRVFDTPDDKIVWDVGHQSYVHKLVTGRRDRFDTLRTSGGLSGFTRISESKYDPFGAGHSSTSVSAALGIAEAERMKGSGAYTVAVLGDGAFTGGMIHEALNNCDSKHGLKLIIIINENEMSISKNIGRFAASISRIRTRPSYFRTKDAAKGFLSHIPLIGKPMINLIVKLKKSLKNSLYGSNYFEDLGLYYIGPIDGNDRELVENMLTEAKKSNESVVLHIKTVKGKGYAPAENDPGKYHSVSPAGSEKSGGFSQEFGTYLTELAEEDEKLCAITAAMTSGTGLSGFQKKYENRFFDVGIAEEHAVTFAAGLASDGMKPVCAIYSTFLQRSYDNIIHDVALQNLPVIFGVDRAGLNASDGATHHGIFDVAFLSEIPGMRIYTPATYGMLKLSLSDAIRSGCPSAIRYPNGCEDPEIVSTFYPDGLPKEPGISLYGFDDVRSVNCAIVVHGRMASEALRVSKKLRSEGITCGIVLCEIIKPYSSVASLIAGAIKNCDSLRGILFLEEEIFAGGFGMCMSNALKDIGALENIKFDCLASKDSFVIPTAEITVFEAAGVDERSVYDAVNNLIK